MDPTRSQGEPRLLVSRDALRTNIRTLRRHLAPEVRFCAVLKADGYGHGARLMAELIAEIEAEEPFLKVDQVAVATFDEAAALSDIAKPLMILRPVENVFLGRQRELLEHAILNGWTLTLSSAAAADDVARVAGHLQKQAKLQIMLDTGMTRCGVPADDFDGLLERVLHHPSLCLTAVCTHFVSSEMAGDPVTVRQLRLFNKVLDRWPILEDLPRHACNSGGVFFVPRGHFNLVRCGISLYGIDPTGRPSVDRALVPVGKWVTPVTSIHEIGVGQGVGYGHAWVAPRRSRVAIVPIGYADGYSRALSNRGVMVVKDHYCGVVGRISMDTAAIDITDAGDVAIGDEVTVIDDNPLSPASVYALSTACGTIPYEMLTRIGSRVRRVSRSALSDEVQTTV